MSFSALNLDSNINKALAACGYKEPTPVQAKSIPEVMAGKDVVVSAQTGTGKTAAFVLPALHRLSLQAPTKKTRILILTPTRELASQITAAANSYGKFLKFNIVSLVGGMPYHNQIKDLGRGADIIVATPGRLMDHMEQRRVDLSNVEMLVLDEADRMLDMGFIDDVQYIAKLTPSARQTLLFSATLDSKLMNAVKHLLKTPVRIDLSDEKISSPNIKQEMYKATSQHHKARLLNHFLRGENVYKAIIFSATKINADKIADQLCDEGFSAAALHGDLRQNVRNRTLEQLRRGKIQFLVATDVAARGIDVSDITHVFNYDLPRFCEDYVHRIGRTGRAGKAGIAISFVLPTDSRHLKNIERYTGQRVQVIQSVDLSQTPEMTKKVSVANEFFGDDDDHDEKPKRGFSDRKKSFSDDRPKRAFGGGDRPQRSFGDDRPKRSFGGDRSERTSGDDRPKRSFSGGDRPQRSFGDDRPKRAFGGERSPRSFSDEKPKRAFGGERRERTFSDDKPKRAFGGERSPRSFSDDKPKRAFGGERSPRSFSDDKPKRAFGGERSPRSFSDEKPKRAFGGERSPRSFSDEKPKRAFGGERRERTFSDDKPKRAFGGERRAKVGGDEKPKRSFTGTGEKRIRSFSTEKREPRFADDKPKRAFGGAKSKSRFGDEKRKRD